MNDLNLKPGQVMLVSAKGVANGKVSLEFAQIVDTGKKAIDLTSLINESDDRFNQTKPRRSWMTGTKESIAKYFPSLAIVDLAEGATLEIGLMDPEIEGLPLNLQIIETTKGSDYDNANVDTKAKRAGKGGDFIMKNGQYIFTKVSVVVGAPKHFSFSREETTRDVAGDASQAIAEALGE
jgi:hypothetical protein